MKSLFTKEQYDNCKADDTLPCECYVCETTFYPQKKQITRGIKNKRWQPKFCSKKCKGINKTTKQLLNCDNCNKEFYKTPSQIKKNKNNFCSLACSASYNNKHKKTGTRRSKLEIWLENQLTILYPKLKIDYNKTDTINAELDIYIPSLKLAFELNGIFHYEPIYGIEKLQKTQNNDERKFQACLEKNIELVLIDTSTQKYFKEKTSQKFLDIITEIIFKKLCS
jgi:hypothetical protein